MKNLFYASDTLLRLGKKIVLIRPIWCSVDLRDGNQALIEPMSLDEKLSFFSFSLTLVLR